MSCADCHGTGVVCRFGPDCDCTEACFVVPCKACAERWRRIGHGFLWGIFWVCVAILVGLALTHCGGQAYALRPSKTSDQLAAEAHARCGRLSTDGDWLTVGGVVVTPLAGVAPPVVGALPSTDTVDRGIVTGAGAGTAAVGAGLVAAAGVVRAIFSRDCATSSSSSASPEVWPARTPAGGGPASGGTSAAPSRAP